MTFTGRKTPGDNDVNAFQSTVHGLVEEFFQMLGDGEAWKNCNINFLWNKDDFLFGPIAGSTETKISYLVELQVPLKRIQSLLCWVLSADKLLVSNHVQAKATPKKVSKWKPVRFLGNIIAKILETFFLGFYVFCNIFGEFHSSRIPSKVAWMACLTH